MLSQILKYCSYTFHEIHDKCNTIDNSFISCRQRDYIITDMQYMGNSVHVPLTISPRACATR